MKHIPTGELIHRYNRALNVSFDISFKASDLLKSAEYVKGFDNYLHDLCKIGVLVQKMDGYYQPTKIEIGSENNE